MSKPSLPPLRSMFEADSDLDYDFDNGHDERGTPRTREEHTHRCPTCSWTATCYGPGCATPILITCETCKERA